jgi:serine/threonine protein kinase
MGVVYLARQLSLNRQVALKMIRSGELASPQERERFLSEAAAIARLQHPGIIQIHEIGTWNDQPSSLWSFSTAAASRSICTASRSLRGVPQL